METFADRLREEMDYSGLTRKELAYKADIKIRALDMYLGTQGSMPPADVAVRLAKSLNVTVEYLVNGEVNGKTLERKSAQIEHLVASVKALSDFDVETLQIIVDRMKMRVIESN